MQKKKVLVIGWDACEWKVVNELIGKGLMPTLKKFLEEGTSGKIATLEPPLSPMLWTSIATGKRAEVHGITGFTEPDPDPNSKTGIRPVLVTSRKVKAIWNILNQEGYKSNVVGWWPSHPAEPINGCMVSNFYPLSRVKDEKKWTMMEGTVHPKRLSDILMSLRVHFSELSGSVIKNFVPDAEKIDQENDRNLFNIVNTLGHAATIHNAATYLMENEPWDFMAVYYDAMDHFSHAAMRFHPPKQEHIDQEKFDLYKDVITAAYRFHDMMLERMLELADKDTTVMILSDHGFHSDHLRPRYIPNEPSGPTYEHAPYGFFAVNGPGIAKNKKIYGGSVLDITPTLLAIYDLPLGADMAGKALVDIFENPAKLKFIDSWEKESGDHGMHPAEQLRNPFAEQEAMNQLVELGYIDKPEEDKAKNVKSTMDESNYNLARGYIHTFRYDQAIPLLEELCSSNNYETRFAIRLFNCYLQKGMIKESEELIRKLREIFTGKFVPAINLSEGLLEMARNNTIRARELFQKVLDVAPDSSTTLTYIAQSFYRRYLYVEAEEYFRNALKYDPQNLFAIEGLANVLFKTGHHEEALDILMELIENTFYFPRAHALIGEILFQTEYYQQATDAFELALNMNGKDARSRKRLIEIYSKFCPDQSKMESHRAELKSQQGGEIIVVTGLPRSGTSLVMQILEKAGIPVFCDNTRKPDVFNPKGYYESALSKTLSFDRSWMAGAAGKALKVPCDLIDYLPENYNYKFIYIKRDFNEILKSTLKTKAGLSDNFLNSFPSVLADTYSKYDEIVNQLLSLRPLSGLLKLDYNQIMHDPQAEITRILEFAGREKLILAEDVIAPDLYQTRLVNN